MLGIYQILNIKNNKRYIGNSINISKRFEEHKKLLNNNSHYNKHLQSAWNIDGEDSFVFTQLIETEVNDLFFYEDLIIKGYNTTNSKFGYNLISAFYPAGRKIFGKSHGEKISNGKSTGRNCFINQKFNKITLLNELGIDKYNHTIWLGRCECGVTKEFNLSNVTTSRSKSCGCSRIKPERPYSRRKPKKDTTNVA